MTKTTEELKREMYDRLADVKSSVANGLVPNYGLVRLEDSLESYLEALRQDRDSLRNKLQAFEFANRSAAELLSEALREPSGLRKTSQAIPQQESTEKAVCERCNGSGRIFAGLLWGVSEPLTVQCSCVSRNK